MQDQHSNRWPLVSVVMPVYNGAKFIASAIECILGQSYTYWDLIVVDDCSSDDTKNIVSRYCQKDLRIVYIKNQINRGVSYSRNVAISSSKGELLMFLDCDDLWSLDKMKRQVEFHLSQRADISFTSYQRFYEDTGCPGCIIRTQKKLLRVDIAKKNDIGLLTTCISRKWFEKYKFDETLPRAEDWALWYDVIAHGGVAMGLNHNLATYRLHRSNASGGKLRGLKYILMMMQQHRMLSRRWALVYVFRYLVLKIVDELPRLVWFRLRTVTSGL